MYNFYLNEIYKAIGKLPDGFYIGKIITSTYGVITVELRFFNVKLTMEFNLQHLELLQNCVDKTYLNKTLKDQISSILMHLVKDCWEDIND